jgi:hypothetical protein
MTLSHSPWKSTAQLKVIAHPTEQAVTLHRCNREYYDNTIRNSAEVPFVVTMIFNAVCF